MYPLKFEKVLKPKVWGGRNLESALSIPLPGTGPIGESWEVSAHPNGPSRVAQGPWKGQTLPELLEKEGEKLIGSDNWNRFGGRFPLLIKYLDINDKLSVQVHPDDAYALEHEGEFGKSECWYILKASPDATLILGMREGLTRQEFRRQAEAHHFQGLFREVVVKAGDFIHVVPGTVHASLNGSVLICEIQQNSDTTYRIYDFDRLENGKPRPLHLDKALDVIAFEAQPRITSAQDRPAQKVGEGFAEVLVRDPYYNVDKLVIDGNHVDHTGSSFAVYSILEGRGVLTHNGTDWPAAKGDTWLVPAGLTVQIQGSITLLRSWTGSR